MDDNNDDAIAPATTTTTTLSIEENVDEEDFFAAAAVLDDEDAFLQNLLSRCSHVMDDDDDDVDNLLRKDFNAVHMFVQENAKVPNISFSVDRKQPKGVTDADSPVLSGMDLMEKFFGANHRTSSALAYSSKPDSLAATAATTPVATAIESTSALLASLDSSTSLMSTKSTVALSASTSTPSIESDASAACANKENLETRAKDSIVEAEGYDTPYENSTANIDAATTNVTIDSTAVAIAAAAAAAASAGTPFSLQPLGAAIMRSYPLPIPFLSSSVTIPPHGLHSKSTTVVNHNTRINSHTPAKIHLDASRDKITTTSANQFGFGRNHFVPSVPRPPSVPKKGSSLIATSLTKDVSKSGNRHNNDSNQHMKSKNGRKNLVTSTAAAPVNEAYERKKQRAKDGRVKLNEAIDHLSLAMGLASTQSMKRSRTIASLEVSDQPTFESMANCIKIAEGAKKWERPTFIGAAANMIEGLNLQCESLMRECLRLKENLSHPSYQNIAEDDDAKHLRLKYLQPSPATNIEPSIKRQKLEKARNTSSRSQFSSISSNTCIMLSISSFLDPHSLIKCLSVSKGWTEINVFRSDEIWEHLSARRFGRKLINYLAHDKLRWIDNFRTMAKRKILPVLRMKMTGVTCMAGVHAGVSVVERSNGYLNCSVKVKSKEDGGTMYTSLPVVELKIVIQNTDFPYGCIIIPDQTLSIDCSTRRKGEQIIEVLHDERFTKRSKMLVDGEEIDGTTSHRRTICSLALFETVALTAYFHAKGCSTIKKFLSKANFVKVLIEARNRTIPVCIPIGAEEGVCE